MEARLFANEAGEFFVSIQGWGPESLSMEIDKSEYAEIRDMIDQGKLVAVGQTDTKPYLLYYKFSSDIQRNKDMCTICKSVPVDVADEFDTCSYCLTRI